MAHAMRQPRLSQPRTPLGGRGVHGRHAMKAMGEGRWVALGASRKPGVGRVFVISAGLICSAIVLGVGAGYRVNVSPSVAVGLYRRLPLPDAVERGMLVIR